MNPSSRSEAQRRLAARFQTVALVASLTTGAVAILILFWVLVCNAKLDSQLEAARRRREEIADDKAILDQQMERETEQVNNIYSDIRTELEKREKVKIEMADILAKAEMLREQQDVFTSKRREILESFKKLDGYYSRQKEATSSR